MQVERCSPDDPHWPDYVAHLERVEMARWVLHGNGQPFERVHFLVALENNAVIGHIALLEQPLISPATAWTGGRETPLMLDGHALREMFVQTFAVEAAYRRQGCGRALQLAALGLTRARGCYQMRSWSSVDKPENYALKLSLGFAVHPAVYETDSGLRVSGVYFVKVVSEPGP